MRTCLLFLILLSGFVKSQAQSKLVVAGVIKDSVTNDLIRDVTVFEQKNEKNKVISNRWGKFYLTLIVIDNKLPVVVVKSMFYDTYYYKLTKQDLRKYQNDTLHLEIKLNFITLKPFVKSAAPDTVFGSKELSVSDYEFYDNHFVMLTYEKRLDKGSKLLYVDQNQNILSSYTIPDLAKSLYKDFTGKVHVVCQHKVYEVNITDDVIQLYPISTEHFEQQIVPWIDTAETNLYMSNFVWYYPKFDYYAYNLEDSTFNKMYTVIDKPLMDLYLAQYKYVDGQDKVRAMKAELATGIDREIWIAIWTGFPNSIYYHQLYAPMFVKNDTVLIFDHYTHKMYRFNQNNQPIDSIDISYHLDTDKKNWKEQLIKDPIRNAIYSVFLREGKYYLKELNTNTGEIVNTYRLTYKYPECIKVYDGYAYYIYRPFESSQKKFLYKEKLSPLTN